ncbi:hypothetical protein GCM10023215_62310 [Pseudonocardia yuanmonensis]|uniref:Nucleotidyltransferase-like protein n=1 Tax=Pseudonocardia yuanmonensis TaxID=1095914 RepID=A0ABP8XMT2_9PSEU
MKPSSDIDMYSLIGPDIVVSRLARRWAVEPPAEPWYVTKDPRRPVDSSMGSSRLIHRSPDLTRIRCSAATRRAH